MKFLLILSLLFTNLLLATQKKDNGFHRYIQVLAVRDIKRTKVVRTKLSKAGYEYIFRSSKKKDQTYYRIVVGPYSSLKEAKEKKIELINYLGLSSAFILRYKTKPQSSVDLKTLKDIEPKEISSEDIEKEYKNRLDKISLLSLKKDDFEEHKEFICKEINELASKNYQEAVLFLASQYVSGIQCVNKDYKKALDYILSINRDNLSKKSMFILKELHAEILIKDSEFKNLTKAKDLFIELFKYKKDDKDYNIFLNKRLGFIAFQNKNYEAMNKWVQNAANLDDIESQFYIAKNTHKGIGRKIDINKAISLYQKCENTYAQCSESLAAIYLDMNSGIEPDVEKAFIYYKQAGSLGSKLALEMIKKKSKVIELFDMGRSEDVSDKLIEHFVINYISDAEINNIVINKVDLNNSSTNIYFTFLLNEDVKSAKIVISKNRYGYWESVDFKLNKPL